MTITLKTIENLVSLFVMKAAIPQCHAPSPIFLSSPTSCQMMNQVWCLTPSPT
jgi:hypothetical protein